MSKKLTTFFSVLVVLVFIAYIIYDSTRPPAKVESDKRAQLFDSLPEMWKVTAELKITDGSLRAVSISPSGMIYAGGDSFICCYTGSLEPKWKLKTSWPVTSLSNCGDSIFASTAEMILVVSADGRLKDEWGPFEDKSFITSVSSNRSYVACADAGNKMVVILDRQGRVVKLIGQNDGQFIIPSPYFDVALDKDNNLYVANTGHRRIETRSTDGRMTAAFGEPGMAPGAFCGCCNPAHFALVPGGFITSEKGINRIKILGKSGVFVEFVSSGNSFVPSVPLDLASADGNTIYAANPADSKIYIFNRK